MFTAASWLLCNFVPKKESSGTATLPRCYRVRNGCASPTHHPKAALSLRVVMIAHHSHTTQQYLCNRIAACPDSRFGHDHRAGCPTSPLSSQVWEYLIVSACRARCVLVLPRSRKRHADDTLRRACPTFSHKDDFSFVGAKAEDQAKQGGAAGHR